MKYALYIVTLIVALVAFLVSITGHIELVLVLPFIPQILQSLPWGLTEEAIMTQLAGQEVEESDEPQIGFTAKLNT